MNFYSPKDRRWVRHITILSSAFLFFCENLIIFLTVVGNILKFAMHTVESLEFVFRGIHG